MSFRCDRGWLAFASWRARGALVRLAASSACVALSALLLAGCRQTAVHAKQGPVLRVCADPDNLPFSNQQLEGFENRLASLIADEMHAELQYTWWAQRRGFIRNTLNAGTCDVVMGVPSKYELTRTTRPYYRSSYVFVSRADRGLHVDAFEDPQLHDLRIGVQMIGDGFANTPPAHALSRRGLATNIVGYQVYGDHDGGIVRAVAARDIDVAVVWGPQAGYFARQQGTTLDLRPVSPPADLPFLPFAYEISIGVRRGDVELGAKLDAILDRRRADIDRLLDQYGVPRAPASSLGPRRLAANRPPPLS